MNFNSKLFKFIIRYLKENNKYNLFVRNAYQVNLKKMTDKQIELFVEKYSYSKYLYELTIPFCFGITKFGEIEIAIYKKYKKEMQNAFENFLKENELFEEFVKNINPEYFHLRTFENKLSDFYDTTTENEKRKKLKRIYDSTTCPHNFINIAFHWIETKQGEAIWRELDKKWNENYTQIIEHMLTEIQENEIQKQNN